MQINNEHKALDEFSNKLDGARRTALNQEVNRQLGHQTGKKSQVSKASLAI